MSDEEDRAYNRAVSALQFFGLELPEQLESLVNAPAEQPRFFSKQLDVDRGCDYFFGVACVFKTYKRALYDKFVSAEEAGRIGDFNHRLDVFMQDGTAAEWSVEGLGSDTWRYLRTDAKKALGKRPVNPSLAAS
jgi:hypothetical protein